MALKKQNDDNVTELSPRRSERDFNGLKNSLHEGDEDQRRWAARDLASFDEAVGPLVKQLTEEKSHVVRDAIYLSLQKIGNQDVVCQLIPFLSEEDAELRNSTIEVLQMIPEQIETHIISLLNHQDSDVRIFAIDILQVLAHAKTPEWLLSVLKDETHVNVVAAAVDRLAEVGTASMVRDIEEVKTKFSDEEYLMFACNTAIRRIKANS
ncbi:HEAT repeat domain-containing protein [Glaciecola sp. MH2013]|uniref:HEAT repeat domain-containing protein n=1 Tax=Glaciecola sp. MH2013 TaxID=2785524 RepID=UPI00189EDA42|nr:HEAT repeat domain-containing protein [Glaciecola sp. MH2013]MBF7073187.1 HEAT repeat domain-containing protein [Glaciecola sp. MH2013]